MIGYHLSFTPGIHRFQFSKSGTGFGTNFYGSGLYVALDMEPIEEWAKEAGDAKCYVYDVEIPDTANIIDDEDKFWDVVARYVGDAEEPSNEDLRKASRYMVDELGIDGLKYWNPEDGNSIVLWNTSIANVISVKEIDYATNEP